MLIVMVTGSPERGGISGLFRGGEGGGAVGGGLEGGGEGGGTETVVDPMFLFQAGQNLGPGCCCFRQLSTLFCLPENILYCISL